MNKIISIAFIASIGAVKILADAPVDIVDLITMIFVIFKRKGIMP